MTQRDHTRPEDDAQDHLLDHEYDGIQEYDNPLPRWWVWIFWGTILFAPLYILFYHFGPGKLAIDKYDAAMVSFFDNQAKELLKLGEINDELLSGLQDDAAMMKGAKKIFQGKCSPCHGMFGEGGIGPNLTDNYWIHGPQPTDIYQVVKEGVPAKGMLAWERQLRPAELLAVSSYVLTMHDSDPPNAKEPQGKEYVPITTPDEPDTADNTSEQGTQDADQDSQPAQS